MRAHRKKVQLAVRQMRPSAPAKCSLSQDMATTQTTPIEPHQGAAKLPDLALDTCVVKDGIRTNSNNPRLYEAASNVFETMLKNGIKWSYSEGMEKWEYEVQLSYSDLLQIQSTFRRRGLLEWTGCVERTDLRTAIRRCNGGEHDHDQRVAEMALAAESRAVCSADDKACARFIEYAQSPDLAELQEIVWFDLGGYDCNGHDLPTSLRECAPMTRHVYSLANSTGHPVLQRRGRGK